ARDGPDLDVQVVPGHRAGRRRQLSRCAAGRRPARSGRADRLAVPDDPAVGGGRLHPAGGDSLDTAHRAARRPADVRPRTAFRVGLVLLVAALAAYPTVGTGYGVRAMLQIFMWVALAASWNLISGLTGYVSFGHVAFFGAGAYTGAILITSAGWSWPAAALAGGLGACVVALVIGYPCLRLKGPYFAIAMLGLNEVLRALVSYFEGLTGGGNGISLPTLEATVSGPVLGAVVLFVSQELVWARFPYLHQLLFGSIIVAVVLLMPRGVLGLLQQKYHLPRTI